MIKKKLSRREFLLLISLLIIGYSIYYYFPGKKMMKESGYKKVLLIGIDGMDPQITTALMDQGHMPHFKKLAQTGSFLKLATSYPPSSPVAWTSIGTGMNPGKHSIFDFIKRNPENYIPELTLSKSIDGMFGTRYVSNITGTPFWRITSEAGIPTTVIRWPVTFPPEKLNGHMLSGLGVPDIKGFLSGYTFYTSRTGVTSDKATNKIVDVARNKNIINTIIFGPRKKKAEAIIDITAPMKITLHEKSIDLVVNETVYKVREKNWSEWIEVPFQVELLKQVYGACKVYLNSINPFEMYMTTIQINPRKPVVDISYPRNYANQLTKTMGLYYTLGMPEETTGLIDGKLDDDAFLAQIDNIEQERDRMFWHEFDHFKQSTQGVFAFAYDSSDRMQHMFWDERVLFDVQEGLSINPQVTNYYINKDNFIGRVLKQLDDTTLLLIFSDHGFTSFERAVSINTWLVDNGFMTLTRTVSEKEDGALFCYVDWKRTKAYAVGFNSIYINYKGREGQGIVVHREEVVNDLVNKLNDFVDPQTGNKVINKAYKREEIYAGPYVKDTPDIIIGFNPGYHMAWETAIGGFNKDVLYDNKKKWNGDHLCDPQFVPGVLFSNVQLEKESASQMDIAPTVLDALDINVPSEVDGKSLLR